MHFRVKQQPSVLFAATLCALASSGSWAADTVCSTVAGGTVTAVTSGSYSTPDTTIAVASNFYGPAKRLLQDYTKSGAPGNGKVIGVCHNATGHLMSEIMGLTSSLTVNGTTYSAHPSSSNEWLSSGISYKYGMLLAANEKAPADLVYRDTNNSTNFTIGSKQKYANGVPALLLNPNQTPTYDAYDLVVADGGSLAEGYYYGDPLDATGTVSLNYPSLMTPIAIGNPTPAPYGAAATAILDDMGMWPSYSLVNKGSSSSTSCGATGNGTDIGVCQYDNIDLTLQATQSSTSGIVAGFVSWAQVLDLGGSPEYITFPDYPVPQWGILLETDATDGTSNANETAASSLWSFMNLGSPGTTNAYLGSGQSWNAWLAANGYGSI